MHGNTFWLRQAEIGSIKKMIFAIKYYFSSTASWLTKKAKSLRISLQSNKTKVEQTDKWKTALADITLCSQKV